MAFLGFLKKEKGKQGDEARIEELIPPPPKPSIEELPTFQFEKEELLPPLKPMKPYITPLVKEAPEEEEENIIPEMEKGFEEKFTPDETIEQPEMQKPVQGPQFQTLFPMKEKRDITVEESPLEMQIKPQAPAIKPIKQSGPQHDVERIEGIPYIRAHRFREIMSDINYVTRNLKSGSTRTKSRVADDSYQNFSKLLELIMKKLDDIERSVFD